MSVDAGSVRLWIPVHLNRYVYVGNDPINQTDPSGNIIAIVKEEVPPPPMTGSVTEIPIEQLHVAEQRATDVRMTKSERMEQQYGVSESCAKGVVGANKSIAGVVSAAAQETTLRMAAEASGVDWRLLAAIGVRETNFVNTTEVDGKGLGVGIFQITAPAGSGIATDLMLSALTAAQILNTAANQFPGIDRASQLGLAIMARGFNTGPYNQYTAGKISGGIDALDRGTADPWHGTGNYVSTVLGMMDCFKP